MDPAVLDLPRSVHLALWLPHADRSPSATERALAVIQGEDEPHTVTADEDVPGTLSSLAELLNTWAREAVAVAAVLPVPGDVGGVPAPVSGDAIDAGECVLVSTPEGSFAAVPQVAAFGSVADTGYLVDWRVTRVPDWSLAVLAAVGSLPDAERDLRTALITATEALDSLEVAHWRPDAAEALAALRATPTHLPPGLDPRRTRVLALAARLRAVVEVATADDGGAVNLWQADQRSAALRHIERAARRAVCAATITP